MMRNSSTITRREALKIAGATAWMAASGRSALAAQYQQADAGWLAACRVGISTHWTAQSQTVGADDWVPFEEAVNRFSPERYVDQIAGAGAEYVIFTSAHALQMLPAPCDAIDRIAPRRTTKRDLIGEIADACHARGLHFILYYNHSCNHGDDPDWEYTVGYHAPDKSRLAANLSGILREMGARYGSKVEGWWFDSCSSLDSHDKNGGIRVTSTEPDYQFPWDHWVDAAKNGFPGRLVTLSAGMLRHCIYSSHQDYEAGEANQLVAVPAAQFTIDHLQGHRWVCIDNPAWLHSKVATPLASPIYSLERTADYVRSCNSVKVPVTFNVDIDRTGLLSADSLKLLKSTKAQLA
jgi:hypothetical protein